MRKWPVNIRLLLVFSIFLAGWLAIRQFFIDSTAMQWNREMAEAADLAGKGFRVIERGKQGQGIETDATTRIPYPGLLGDDFTFITTTLGSLQAKEISTNPDFAALVVRFLSEAGMQKGDRAGLIISGSFPALAVSALAALKTMEIEPVIISSPGASSYGANQPGATWMDMEHWLAEKGVISSRSVLVTPGAENDRGEGLTEEGMEILLETARRNRYTFTLPGSLTESIKRKTDLLLEEDIRILINIGGNQAAVGGCPHASTLPIGFHTEIPRCNHADRGVIQEINARGIPVVHLLNIRDLAYRYGMDLAPGSRYAPSTRLYHSSKTNRAGVILTVLPGLLALWLLFPVKTKKSL